MKYDGRDFPFLTKRQIRIVSILSIRDVIYCPLLAGIDHFLFKILMIERNDGWGSCIPENVYL